MKAADAPANNAEHDGGFFCDLMKKSFATERQSVTPIF